MGQKESKWLLGATRKNSNNCPALTRTEVIDTSLQASSYIGLLEKTKEGFSQNAKNMTFRENFECDCKKNTALTI